MTTLLLRFLALIIFVPFLAHAKVKIVLDRDTGRSVVIAESAVISWEGGNAELRSLEFGPHQQGRRVMKVTYDPKSGHALTSALATYLEKRERLSKVRITFVFQDGTRLSYDIPSASPSRWKAPELNSGSDTHVVEEMEFVVEKVERA